MVHFPEKLLQISLQDDINSQNLIWSFESVVLVNWVNYANI